MARRSVRYNHLEEKVDIVTGDIVEASQLFALASFDVVTSNPPYMNDAHGLKNPGDAKAIARHEVKCTLEDVVREGTRVLKPGGRFYMVHRPRRLIEIIQTMKKHGLEPKRMKMVHPYVDREANMVLIEAVRGGGALLKMEAPVIVFNEQGEYKLCIRDRSGCSLSVVRPQPPYPFGRHTEPASPIGRGMTSHWSSLKSLVMVGTASES